MAAGLPLISANVNGIKDYTEDGVSGCCIDPTDVDDMVNAIQSMYKDKRFRKKCSIYNQKKAKEYDISKTNEIMKWVYKEML
jgi:glycosyltransferase involved in cell wall biosynthesis